jgi:hypothetical protein
MKILRLVSEEYGYLKLHKKLAALLNEVKSKQETIRPIHLCSGEGNELAVTNGRQLLVVKLPIDKLSIKQLKGLYMLTKEGYCIKVPDDWTKGFPDYKEIIDSMKCPVKIHESLHCCDYEPFRLFFSLCKANHLVNLDMFTKTVKLIAAAEAENIELYMNKGADKDGDRPLKLTGIMGALGGKVEFTYMQMPISKE